MKESELLINTIKKEKKARQAAKKHPQTSVIFQPLLLVGPQYNQALVNLTQKDNPINANFIDFSKLGTSEKSSGDWIEKEIERICHNHKPEFSLLCFLNINEISGTTLEKSLLPFFDHHQNTQHKDLDLSPFLLVTTSSTSQLGKISPPLLSRLKCVNQTEAELPKTFLDRHFSLVLIGSILLVFFLFLLFFLPSKNSVKFKKITT